MSNIKFPIIEKKCNLYKQTCNSQAHFALEINFRYEVSRERIRKNGQQLPIIAYGTTHDCVRWQVEQGKKEIISEILVI